MGKNKLQRWDELLTFGNVFQSPEGLKGNWNEKVFKNPHPITLELACGRGEYTVSLSHRYPARNFIGIDIKGHRMHKGAKAALEGGHTNAAFARFQIQHILDWFVPGEVSEIWITFPDPQPQKTREKQRLTHRFFLEKYKSILVPQGLMHLKTDNTGLYEYTREVLGSLNIAPEFETDDVYKLGLPEDDILHVKTNYEEIFSAKGETIKYLRFRLS